MRTMSRSLAVSAIGVAVWTANIISPSPGFAAAPKIVSRWTLVSDPVPPRNGVKLTFKDANGSSLAAGDGLKADSAAKTDAYELQQKTGETARRIPVEVVLPDATAGLVRSVDLVPAEAADSDAEYTISIKAGMLTFRIGGTDQPNDAYTQELDNALLKLDQEFQRSRTLMNKIEVQGGTGGGDGSVRLSYGIDRLDPSRWLHLDLTGTGDFNFQAQNRNKYFNSLTGELRFFHPMLVSPPWSNDEDAKRYIEPQLHLRAESDQQFDNVDGLVGAGVGIYTKDPVSAWLSDLFVGTRTEAVVSPLLVFTYDYVHELAKNDQPNIMKQVDTEGGDNRLKGTFDWSLPIIRGVKAENVPPLLSEFGKLLGGPFAQGVPDTDLLVEVWGLYSFDESRFFDKTRLSLDMRPQNGNRLTPSISLSWARGEAAPLLRQINAFLVGLKMNL